MLNVQSAHVFSLILGLSLSLSSSALLAQTLCDTTQISVISADPEIDAKVCRVAAQATQQLEACGLTLDKPLTVTIIGAADATNLNCIGIFDCGTNKIEILHPDAIALGTRSDNAFDQLPIQTLFESVIVHELAHAFLQATSQFDLVPYTEAEYVAYSMQMEALSKADRQIILDRHITENPGSKRGINEMVLAMSPPALLQFLGIISINPKTAVLRSEKSLMERSFFLFLSFKPGTISALHLR